MLAICIVPFACLSLSKIKLCHWYYIHHLMVYSVFMHRWRVKISWLYERQHGGVQTTSDLERYHAIMCGLLHS